MPPKRSHRKASQHALAISAQAPAAARTRRHYHHHQKTFSRLMSARFFPLFSSYFPQGQRTWLPKKRSFSARIPRMRQKQADAAPSSGQQRKKEGERRPICRGMPSPQTNTKARRRRRRKKKAEMRSRMGNNKKKTVLTLFSIVVVVNHHCVHLSSKTTRNPFLPEKSRRKKKEKGKEERFERSSTISKVEVSLFREKGDARAH